MFTLWWGVQARVWVGKNNKHKIAKWGAAGRGITKFSLLLDVTCITLSEDGNGSDQGG